MRLEPWVQDRKLAASFWGNHGRVILASSSGACVVLGVLLIAWYTGHFSLNLLAHEHGEEPVPLPAVIFFAPEAGGYFLVTAK